MTAVRPRLNIEPYCLHRRWALAYVLRRERRQRAGLAIDAVGRQLSGSRAGREQKIPRRVEPEGAGNRLGRRLTDRGQPARGVDHEAGDAVVATVADVKEFRRRSQVDLRAGV